MCDLRGTCHFFRYKALAHGWLMTTLRQVDLLTNTDLDDNLQSVLAHVDTCVREYGTNEVYGHVHA